MKLNSATIERMVEAARLGDVAQAATLDQTHSLICQQRTGALLWYVEKESPDRLARITRLHSNPISCLEEFDPDGKYTIDT